MTVNTYSILAAAAALLSGAAARSFTDSRGDTFTTDKDKPTLVTWAHTAASLHSYGLDGTQLLGTYGEYINDGSDFDFTQPEMGSSFPADPDADELALLKDSINLSPGCEETAGYCVELDIAKLAELSPDFMLIHGYRHSPWGIANIIENITAAGFPEDRIIFNEVSMAMGPDAKNCTDEHHKDCYGRSMIDQIETFLELADFLNLDKPAELEGEIEDLCVAATNFAANMKKAQEKGVRALAAYLVPTGTSYFAHVTDDPVLRMMEELGAPIIHPGACTNCTSEYYWEWIGAKDYFNQCTADQIDDFKMAECNDETLYPVDFWLYDHRTTPTVLSDEFAEAYPDQAIQRGQLGMWAIGGRKMSPGHAATILNNVGDKFAQSDRIYAETKCTPADVSSVPHRTTGLGPGEYACYDESFHNEKYFKNCPAAGSVSTESEEEEGEEEEASVPTESDSAPVSTKSSSVKREASILAGVVAVGLLL